MVVSEARHLAALGEIIGRTDDVKALRTHADALSASLATYRKNVLLKPFLYKNDHFTKTGSGQT